MTIQEITAPFVFRMPVDVRWSDMDEMGHVNNAVYLTYFEQARIWYFQEACSWNWKENGLILANVNIDYIRPLIFPTPATIRVRVSRLGTKSFEMQYLITSTFYDKEVLMTKGSTTMVMFDYASQSSFPIPAHLREKIVAYEKQTNVI